MIKTRDWLVRMKKYFLLVLLATIVGSVVSPVAGMAGQKGDLLNTGTVTIADALLALRIVVGLDQPTSYELSAGDVNGDGLINVADALLILSEVVGLGPTSSSARTLVSVPIVMVTSVGNGQAQITWNAVPGAASYDLYWSTAEGVTTNTGIKISNVTMPYLKNGLANGQTCYFIIAANITDGNSIISNQVAAIPSSTGIAPLPPDNVVTASGNDKISIQWNDSMSATSYNLYWSPSPVFSKSSGNKISNANAPYVHSGIINGIIYNYMVTAVNSYGESNISSIVSATPAATGSVPSVPSGLTISGSEQLNVLNWDSVANATSYNLYWSVTPNLTKTNSQKVTVGPYSSYMHMNLKNGSRYYYVVTSQNDYGESIISSEVSGTPQAYISLDGPSANAPDILGGGQSCADINQKYCGGDLCGAGGSTTPLSPIQKGCWKEFAPGREIGDPDYYCKMIRAENCMITSPDGSDGSYTNMDFANYQCAVRNGMPMCAGVLLDPGNAPTPTPTAGSRYQGTLTYLAISGSCDTLPIEYVSGGINVSIDASGNMSTANAILGTVSASGHLVYTDGGLIYTGTIVSSGTILTAHGTVSVPSDATCNGTFTMTGTSK